jgi:phytol kinase
MLNQAAGCAATVVALATLFLFARYAVRSGRESPEGSRKIVHIGMGAVCMTFPWLFSSAWPVVWLALGALIALSAVRLVPLLREQFGGVLQGVARKSYGEFAFIAGVTGAFVLSHGNTLEYIVPVAVLTFADSLAALAGVRTGVSRFTIFGATRSLEGSAVFFAVALLCVAIPFVAAHQPGIMISSVATSAALAAVEAVSWGGLDNLAIPVLGTLVLRAIGGLGGAR